MDKGFVMGCPRSISKQDFFLVNGIFGRFCQFVFRSEEGDKMKIRFRRGAVTAPLLATCLGLIWFWGMAVAAAETPQQIAKRALDVTVLLVMADANGQTLGAGSGFFVRTNQIATNFHVIEGAARGAAKRVGQKTEYNIEGFTAMDEKHDLAILQVSVSGVQPLPLGDSDAVEIGDTVYVVGNPKGYFEGTFSDGIISGIRGDSTDKRLQMTAPISPGSSGGPVLNGGGEVIGVSVMTIEGGQNLNFAIPSNYLTALVTRLGPAKPLSKGKQSISADTYFIRGYVNSELGDYKGAIAAYTQAIRLKPADASAYNNRGSAKADLGQYFTAIQDYDTAIRLKPDYVDAYYNRGNAKADLGQYFSAISDYDTVIQLEPDAADAYLNRGMAKADLGQYFTAIQDYDTAIRLKPDYVKAYHSRGIAKGKLGQHVAAITDYDTAIRLKPDDAVAYYNRGLAKGKLKQYDAAISDFDTAIRLKPDYADAYYSRGLAKALLGQYVAAIADYDTAIRLKPDYADAYNNRGVAKYVLGRTWEAKRDFQTALRLAERAGDEGLKARIESTIRDFY